MNSSLYHFPNWSLEKQFAAAQYYLTIDKPQIINEAQKSQLMALHMQATYGPYKEGVLLPEIQNCTRSEKSKRFKDWKSLGNESRISAMRKFLDLMGNLLPNWHKNEKIYTGFELEWAEKPKKTEETLDLPSSPSLSIENTSSRLESFSNRHLNQRKLMLSTSPPLYSPSNFKSFVNRSEMNTAMKSVRDGSQQISTQRFRDAIYKMRYLNSPDNEEPEDHTPIILRNLFDNLESQYNSKKGKKPMPYKDTFVNIPIKIPTSENLEEKVGHIKELLSALEENANEAYDIDGDALSSAMTKYETDIVESILRPKLELLSGIIKEIEEIFRKEFSEKVGDVSKIHGEFVDAVDKLFTYMQLLDKSKLEVNQQKINSEKTVKMLEQGFLAIKELNDPTNAKYSLFGVTKLSKANYVQNLQISKSYLPQEDVDIMTDIQAMLEKLEEKVASLNTELKQKEVEVVKIKRLLKEVQEKSYKDNIDLANQCKKLKESLGLLRGGKGEDMEYDVSYKSENDLLKNEIEKLKSEKDALGQEIIALNMREQLTQNKW